jgi:hypothetical protein
LDTYSNKETFFLNEKNIGVYIKPNTWITFKCSGDAIILVLCDHEFFTEDRIDDYDEIIKYHS